VICLVFVQLVERSLDNRIAEVRAVCRVQNLASVVLGLASSFDFHELGRSLVGSLGVHGLTLGVDLGEHWVAPCIRPAHSSCSLGDLVARLLEVDVGVLVIVVFGLGV
jgi:hypothetical protein